jgi:hypothetical protein
MESKIADDNLDIGGITEERFGVDTLENRRKARRLFSQGLLLGVWKEGGRLRGSRRAIRESYQRRAALASGEAAANPQ